MLFILFVPLFLCLVPVGPCQALTVEEAYRAIPHRQTTYRALRSELPAPEARLLESFFALIDRAVVERVETLQRLQSQVGRHPQEQRDGHGRAMAEIRELIQALVVPKEIEYPRGLVVQALREQEQFFAAWERSSDRKAFARKWRAHPLVRRSSERLKAAGAKIADVYSMEAPLNRRAFLDHLSALALL